MTTTDEPAPGPGLVEWHRARHRLRMSKQRDAVLRYPDLAQRLTQPPISYRTPAEWNGLVAWTADNPGPRPQALAELVREAYVRIRKDTQAS